MKQFTTRQRFWWSNLPQQLAWSWRLKQSNLSNGWPDFHFMVLKLLCSIQAMLVCKNKPRLLPVNQKCFLTRVALRRNVCYQFSTRAESTFVSFFTFLSLRKVSRNFRGLKIKKRSAVVTSTDVSLNPLKNEKKATQSVVKWKTLPDDDALAFSTLLFAFRFKSTKPKWRWRERNKMFTTMRFMREFILSCCVIVALKNSLRLIASLVLFATDWESRNVLVEFCRLIEINLRTFHCATPTTTSCDFCELRRWK